MKTLIVNKSVSHTNKYMYYISGSECLDYSISSKCVNSVTSSNTKNKCNYSNSKSKNYNYYAISYLYHILWF